MIKEAQERFYQLLGNRIREARKSAMLKQEAFASHLNLSRASIVNIEKGRQHPPIYLLLDIAKILNVEVCSLIPELPSSEVNKKLDWEKIVDEKVNGNIKDGKKLLDFLNELNAKK